MSIKRPSVIKAACVLFAIWCAQALFMIYHFHHHAGCRSYDQQTTNLIQPIENYKEVIVLPPKCGKTKHTYLRYYGEELKLDKSKSSEESEPKHIYGCSTYKKYCFGPPKPIPCCTKIMYDAWYAFDEYLTKYDVTYSLTLGSLLFAVRNGRHMVWDNRDIDLSYFSPKENTLKAIEEFSKDYNISTYGRNHRVHGQEHHILDTYVFHKLHHEKYGYPDKTQRFCFVDYEFDYGKYEEYKYPHTLTMYNYKTLWRTHIHNNPVKRRQGDSGEMRKRLSKGKPMIPVEYDGSNGMKPPRQMYVYADFYEDLNEDYKNWFDDITPKWISDRQLEVM